MAHRVKNLDPNNPTSYNIVLWLVAIGFFMQTLDATIVNTALPSMAESLNESPLRMQSVVMSYSLAMAMFIPASGWVADRFGTRRSFIVAILLFSLGSLFCALSHSLFMLNASRVLQGIGGSMLLPIGRLAVLRSFPREKFLQAMSFVAIPGLVGPLIGPSLGGWFVAVASWHWIFYINLPVGLVGALISSRYMPNYVSVLKKRFDLAGYLLLATSMLTISIALEGLTDYGFGYTGVLILFIVGLASLTAYWLHAAKHKNPLFSLSLFNTASFRIGLLGNLFARIGSGSMPFLIPLLFQVGLGYSALSAGMLMIPVAAAGMVAKFLATPLITRFGYRRVLVCNTLLIGSLIASFALITQEQIFGLMLLQITVFGAVNSLQFTAMNSIALKDLEEGGASSGNTLLTMIQMLAMSFGVAAAGGLLGTFDKAYVQENVLHSLPAFHATFICVGLITCASAWIFWQLGDERTTKTGMPIQEPAEVA